MKYISIDIETTGLDVNKCQIIEFGAIIEDSNNIMEFEELPKFHCHFKYDFYNLSPNAMEINYNKILEVNKLNLPLNHHEIDISMNVDLCYDGNDYGISWFKTHFSDWILKYYGENEIVFAGKNVSSFDLKFLENKGFFGSDLVKYRAVLDPTTVYVDWEKDKLPPSLNKCLERAKVKKKVTHNALEDAFDVIQVLRKKYNSK
jgi:oligoribonuclease (3'-5' exoribonuclease)